MNSKIARGALCAAIAALCVTLAPAANADGLAVHRNSGGKAPFSSSVWAGDTLYVSGMLAEPTVAPGSAAGTRGSISGDTHAQTLNILTNLRKMLQTQGLDMGDVVSAHVYVAGDPAHGGKMDFAGMNSAYLQFFGTQEQPNKPVRSAVQVAALAMPGALVEIEVIAVRPARP